jgi:hypothetical protein
VRIEVDVQTRSGNSSLYRFFEEKKLWKWDTAMLFCMALRALSHLLAEIDAGVEAEYYLRSNSPCCPRFTAALGVYVFWVLGRGYGGHLLDCIDDGDNGVCHQGQ